MEEVRYPLDAYPNLQEFFARSLKQGVREKDRNAKVVAPVDGTVMCVGEITAKDARLPQIKVVDEGSSSISCVSLSTSSRNVHLTQCHTHYMISKFF